ncbi:MAG: WecB/TagA/CpsF family glycosyltransferase [bacterium]
MTKFFDYKIYSGTISEIINEIVTIISNNKKAIINPINAFIFTLGLKNPELKTSLLNSDFIPADGQSIIWALKFLHKTKQKRLAGIDLMYLLFEIAYKNNYKIFLLGSTDNTLIKISNSLPTKYKNLVVGMENGFFDEEQQNNIIEKINLLNPQILFLGLNSPKKEILAYKFKPILNCNIILSVGGSFEILAGNKNRAPKIFQKLGFEWFYRLIQEPRRLFKRYLFSNLKFIYVIILEKYKQLINT